MDKSNLRRLQKRILDFSYIHKLSHLGSCLTALPIILEIYEHKKKNEKFVLSSGHAALALYTVIEEYEGRTIEEIWNHHQDIHPDKCDECKIDCSSGSLGQGLPIAVGLALANRNKNVYCLISDGECSEGSVWEAMRIINEQRLWNLKLYFNINGWGAYKKIELHDFVNKLNTFMTHKEVRITDMDNWPDWVQGQAGHYVAMNEEQYKEALEVVR